MATLYCKACNGTGCAMSQDSCNCKTCKNCSGTGSIPEVPEMPSPTYPLRPDLSPQAILDLQDKFGSSEAPSTNPKDLVGRAKVNMALVPGTAIAHEAIAMMDGKKKYDAYNWRGRKVSAEVYIAAALRHIEDYYNGEDYASDSGAHHLGHARACLGIVLDATETGNLVDDRPPPAAISQLLERLNKVVLDKGLHLPREVK